MKNQMLFEIDDPAATHRPGKDEMNFAEFPITLLTDRVPKGQRIIKFEDTVYDEKRKKIIPRRRIIEGSEEYGLPTATDDLVILALIQLTKQRGDFTKPEVEFSRLELIRMLGWKDEGRNYERIKLSLLRIKVVNYIYDNAWWDSRQKMWTTKAFSIIDNVEINDSRTGQGQGGLFPSRIVWNEVVFDSFQAGFLRDIDFHLCIRLEHPIALRMYRLLGKRFYVRPEWVFDLREFAYGHMWLGKNYEGGTQIARKLKPAIAELEKAGFLEPLSDSERFIKKGREWSIRFIQKTATPTIQIEPTPSAKPEPSPLVAALAKRGVTAATAAELVGKHPAKQIEDKIEVFDSLSAAKDKRLAKSPAGFLVASIRENYAQPNGFTPKAEQERQAQAKRQAEVKEGEERRRKREEDERERRLAAQVKTYRQSRTPEQIARLEADAIALASDEIRKNLNDPAMKNFREALVLGLVRDHIAHLIQTGQLVLEPA